MPDLFRRPHHNAILEALRCFDGDLFEEAECFFGGGTAIVLSLGEYRESVDIDFLCASKDGYRILRDAIWGKGLEGLVRPNSSIIALRDVRADQYGIRTILKVRGMHIKFEIVKEARIPLHGTLDDRFGLPVLNREDMFAEKLLANADRWNDKSVLSRDLVDLSMMILRWGDIPLSAWEQARSAYGQTVDDAYRMAIAQAKETNWLQTCMDKMGMDPQVAAEVMALHGREQAPGTFPFDV